MYTRHSHPRSRHPRPLDRQRDELPRTLWPRAQPRRLPNLAWGLRLPPALARRLGRQTLREERLDLLETLVAVALAESRRRRGSRGALARRCGRAQAFRLQQFDRQVVQPLRIG